MQVTSVAKFERFFRVADGLDVDKEDLRRYSEFLNQKVYDLLLRGVAGAKANRRDIIEPHDLPITKGLQESIDAFPRIESANELKPVLDHLSGRPALELTYSEATDAKLPDIAGGVSVALARSFRIVDPELRNPRSEHWERAFRLFDLLL